MNPLALKLVAAGALSLCGLLIGHLLSKTHARRGAALSALEYAMSLLENKMLLERMPLASALASIDHGIFSRLGEVMVEKGVSALEAWVSVKREASSDSGWSDEDLTALTEFFSSLGVGGLHAQKLLFEKTREAIKPLKNGAFDKYKETSKLYSTLGALFGLALSILLL